MSGRGIGRVPEGPWIRIHQSSLSRRGGRVVYRGGLENRFGLTANGGSNPSLSASLRPDAADGVGSE